MSRKYAVQSGYGIIALADMPLLRVMRDAFSCGSAYFPGSSSLTKVKRAPKLSRGSMLKRTL